MYFSVFILLTDILWLYLDATISDTTTILGVSFQSRGPVNPLALLRVVCIPIFLYLYWKRSKYAWYLLIITILLNIPLYWISRMCGIYFQPPNFVPNDVFTLAGWIVLIFYTVKLRADYLRFVCSNGTLLAENHQGASNSCLSMHEEESDSNSNRVSHVSNTNYLTPHTQTQIGKLGAYLVIIYGLYLVIVNRFYMIVFELPPKRFFFVLALFYTLVFVIPGLYIFALTYRKRSIATVTCYIFLAFAVIRFLFEGIRKLVLLGDFSRFVSFWGPLGIVTIFWWIGYRGLKRLTASHMVKGECDTIMSLSMYIGIFLGFFCGGKIIHDFLSHFWPDVPYYDLLRWGLPCLAGGAGGSFIGSYIGAYIGYIIDKIIKAKCK